MLTLRTITRRVWDDTFFQKALFLITGVLSTLCAQSAFYQGGAEKSTLLPVLANFIGISAALLLPTSGDTASPSSSKSKLSDPEAKRSDSSRSHHIRFFGIAMLEVGGNVLGVLGLIFAGSGLFQVVYSSVVLFTALLSKIFLRRSPQTKQWIALFLIVFGLALSALGGAQGSSPGQKSTVEHERDQIRSTMIGVGLTMLCATLYASSYISVEWILQDAADPPSHRDLQAYAGLYGLSIIMIYTILYTIPNWSILVVANVESKNGSLSWVYACYILIALSGFFHSVSYYKLVASVGAVSTGVLQSLRAVSVFGISSIAFCSQHSEQCVNGPKIISMVVVAIGLTAYSHWAAPRKCESPS